MKDDNRLIDMSGNEWYWHIESAEIFNGQQLYRAVATLNGRLPWQGGLDGQPQVIVDLYLDEEKSFDAWDMNRAIRTWYHGFNWGAVHGKMTLYNAQKEVAKSLSVKIENWTDDNADLGNN